MKVCLNPECGKPIVARPGEGQVKHARRRFCSVACVHAAMRNQPFAYKEEKTCANTNCGEVYQRRDNEGAQTFSRRLYCGAECARDAVLTKQHIAKEPLPHGRHPDPNVATQASSRALLQALLRYGLRHDDDLCMGVDAFYAAVEAHQVSL